MSLYLEIPQLNQQFPYKMFLSEAMDITYPHWHKEIEMIYAYKGTINIGVDQSIIELNEGEIIFFGSGEPHYFLASPDSKRYVYQFDLKLFDESNLRDGEDSLTTLFEQGVRHSQNWPEKLTVKVKDILVELYYLELNSLASKNYLVKGNLYRLIGILYDYLPKRENESVEAKTFKDIRYKETLERLNKVFDYIENRYQEVITLENIAQVIGISPYYFSRFFKTATGQTFTQFLIEYRVNQAKFILANEKLPMIEVAEKSGFASVKTFHHVFKKNVGMSPLQYQNSIKETEQIKV